MGESVGIGLDGCIYTLIDSSYRNKPRTKGKTMNAAKMIARRTNKGFNPAESRALLADITRSHTGDNLAFALVYNEFATAAQAAKFTK